MKLGVVGLPNVGKSTLFNAITNAGAECANYPFCTIEPNVGIVAVPDERLTVLERMHNSKKVIPAVLEFVDIAGLVKGAAKGEGLGNKFLSHIRGVDAIVHVVRCFNDSNITHVGGCIDPKSDIETINLELILADIESCSKRLDKAQKNAKGHDKKFVQEAELLARILEHLENGQPLRTMQLTENEKAEVQQFFFITAKKVIYAANVAEGEINGENDFVKAVREVASKENAETIVVSAKIESEIATLQAEEKQLFLQDLGLKQSGLERIIKSGYKLLGLISFLTAGEKETRAWTIEKGTLAPQAAGKIHTDFEKKFIRAEVVSYSELVLAGNILAAKEKGKVRLEGKLYQVQDGDVVHFRVGA